MGEIASFTRNLQAHFKIRELGDCHGRQAKNTGQWRTLGSI